MTTTCLFNVSFEPSTYLRGMDVQSGEAYLRARSNAKVKYVALCQSPIQYVSSVFGAFHEFVVIGMGASNQKRFTGPGPLGNPVKYKKAEFVIIEFSKNDVNNNDDKAALLNLTSFTLDIMSTTPLDVAFRRRTFWQGMSGVSCKKDIVTNGQFTVGDVLHMSGSLASAGYDIVDNTCRHFARSLFSSVKHGQAKRKPDNEQLMLRRTAKWACNNGFGGSVRSAVSGSFLTMQTAEIFFIVMQASTDGGAAIAMELAMNKNLWAILKKIFEQNGPQVQNMNRLI